MDGPREPMRRFTTPCVRSACCGGASCPQAARGGSASSGFPRVATCQDAADDASARPDFAVLMYPVIAVTGPEAHRGSADQLRGAGVAAADLAKYSPHLNVSARTPPTMLIHAADDTSVPVENSLLMYQALHAAGVRSELHVFDGGGHGFGLRGVAGRDVAVWPTLVQNWSLSDGAARR
jgi:acetyl esterase/lipase